VPFEEREALAEVRCAEGEALAGVSSLLPITHLRAFVLNSSELLNF
jgi:hypothetical protein